MKHITPLNLNNSIEQYYSSMHEWDNNFIFNDSRDQEYLYLEHNKERYSRILSILSNLIEERKTKTSNIIRILDIGFSPFSYILRYFLDHEILVVADKNKINEERIISHLNAEFLHNDLNTCNDLAGEYDIIIFSEVFEHLFRDERSLIKVLNNGLMSGGSLIFTAPNFFSFKNYIYLLFRKQIAPMHYQLLESDGSLHIREYSLPEVIKLLNQCDSLHLTESRYERYFDSFRTLMVYRTHKLFSILPVMIYSFITFLIPQLRIGFSVITIKD